MDGDYVFLCGIMWCNYGWAEAGVELLRAADSDDPDAKALAMAMLTTKTTHSRKTATNLVDSRCGGRHVDKNMSLVQGSLEEAPVIAEDPVRVRLGVVSLPSTG